MTTSQELLGGELADVRDAVHEAARGVTERYGRAYFIDCVHSHKFPEEMWTAMGEQGLLGLGVPEEYGGSGGGLVEVTAAMEALSAAGRADGDVPAHRVRARDDPAPRQRGAEGAVRRAHRNRRVAHGVRDHRAERGHQLVADRDHRAAPGRRQLPAQRPEGLHLRGRLVGAHDGRVPQHEAVGGRRPAARAWPSSSST